MLDGKLSDYARAFVSYNLPPIHHYGTRKDDAKEDEEDDNDGGPSPGAIAHAQVTLAVTKGEYQNTVLRSQNRLSCLERNYPRDLQQLATCINQLGFPNALRRFVFHQRQPNAQNVPANLPEFSSSINAFHSATATFYAPSDMCGAGGMYRERIWANRQWKGKPRYDTVFVKVSDEEDDDDEELEIMHGMLIARVLLFFSFHDPVLCEEVPCALVNWFMPVSNQRDGVMGMWELKLEMVGIQVVRPMLEVVNFPGNPRVKFSDPYPYPPKPRPLNRGSGFRQVRVKGFPGFPGKTGTREPRNLLYYKINTLHYKRILGLETRNRLEPPSLAAALPAFVGQRWPVYAVVGHHWSLLAVVGLRRPALAHL